MTAVPRATPALRPRSLALFGGSFDPIHSGHLAVARAARRRFHLDAVHFIPAGQPPHKRGRELAPYPVRYAMVALACVGHPYFVPSTAEAGADYAGSDTFYSIDTVRACRRKMRRGAKLWFIVGADAFLEIGTWKESDALLESCDFIVASRPGVNAAALRRAVPPRLLAPGPTKSAGLIPLRGTAIHLLDSVFVPISSTEIRNRVARGLSIRGLVPEAVEDYIWKLALYR